MENLRVTAAIIKFNDLILCMQRNKSKHDYTSYKFEFPGGKVEKDESNCEALKRELSEEMNIHVDLSENNHYLTVQHNYPDFSITLHSYICEVKSQDFQMKEHISYRWLPIHEIEALDWADADRPIVQKLISER